MDEGFNLLHIPLFIVYLHMFELKKIKSMSMRKPCKYEK